MSKRACQRIWEVEAARDGRVSGSTLADHRRHMAGCAECAKEHTLLQALADRLRADLPVDELAVRRVRGSLLKAAQVGRSSPRARRTAWGLLAVAGFIVTVAGLRVLERPPPPNRPADTVVVATVMGGAEWARRDTPAGQRIDLWDGALHLAVQRPPTGAPLVVRLPDGEIEDVGTSFTVVVREGRTQSIAVTDGAVVFRRPGEGDVRLGAGDRWAREERLPAAQVPKELEPAVRREAPRARAPAVPAPSASSSGGEDIPSAAAEDAAYLHVVALLREGRTAEGRLAAQDYLRRFPRGFRRAELERVAR